LKKITGWKTTSGFCFSGKYHVVLLEKRAGETINRFATQKLVKDGHDSYTK
jgi:hypothetical protein